MYNKIKEWLDSLPLHTLPENVAAFNAVNTAAVLDALCQFRDCFTLTEDLIEPLHGETARRYTSFDGIAHRGPPSELVADGCDESAL